jgi:hypothetical protein
MLRMDDPEAEEVGVDQLFDARMKRATAVLQAVLDYYRVKKVPPIATVQRIEIEDAALALVTGEFCLTDVALRLDTLRYHFNANSELLADEDGFPVE